MSEHHPRTLPLAPTTGRLPPTLPLAPVAHARGTVALPGSKSISNRALLLAALAEGSTQLTGLLDADDTRRMVAALRTLGVPTRLRPALFASNHVSYTDITVLGSLIVGSFVAKAEVAGWPLFGWLAKLQRTVFVDRRMRNAAFQRDAMTARLARSFRVQQHSDDRRREQGKGASAQL